MKKINYLILGLAGIAMASCSQDELVGPANGDGNVSVRIHLPGDALGTRAGTDYGNGTSNKVLNYAVYDANSGNLLFEGVEPFGTSTETVLNLNLLKNSYKLAFFAQSVASQNTAAAEAPSNAVYEFNATAQTITVNYENMTSKGNFNDAYDCFYNVVTVDGATAGSIDVDLYRPMAQINWGTDDIASTDEIKTIFGPDGEYIVSTLAVNSQDGLPTTLNFMRGELSGSYTGDLGEFEIPQGAYPIEGYDYVAVQYVLAGAPAAIVSADNGMTASSQTLYDLTLTISNAGNPELNGDPYQADAVAVQSVPVQANYQTNIYGTLLSYNFSANIEVIPGFADTNNVPVTPWDGKTLTYPEVTNSATPVTITQPSDLAGLADMITNGTNLPAGVPQDFKGYTIQLEGNVDMGGNSLSIGVATRAGTTTTDSTKPFRGTFDGNGKTISGLNITYKGDSGDAVAAFIPNLDNTGELKNVTFDNVTIDGGAAEQASIVGLVTNGAKVSGVTVSGGSITATEGAAGIVGRILSEGTVENCTNYADITVSAKNGGGIVGAAYYGNKGMTISNCKNYGKVVATAKVESIGGIVATCSADVIGCINYGPVGDSTIAAPAGGIVGYQISSGSIKNCTNEGTIMGAAEVAGIVAFIGNVTYAGYTTNIYLTGNTNKGTLNGSGTVGGIIGINRNGCYLENNTNSAPSMTGKTVAGIVGNAMTNQGTTSAEGYVWLVFNSEGVNSNVNNTLLVDMHGTTVQDIFTGTLYVGSVLTTN